MSRSAAIALLVACGACGRGASPTGPFPVGDASSMEAGADDAGIDAGVAPPSFDDLRTFARERAPGAVEIAAVDVAADGEILPAGTARCVRAFVAGAAITLVDGAGRILGASTTTFAVDRRLADGGAVASRRPLSVVEGGAVMCVDAATSIRARGVSSPSRVLLLGAGGRNGDGGGGDGG